MVFSTPWMGTYVEPSSNVEDKSVVHVWNQTTIHLSSAPYWCHRLRPSKLLVRLAGSSVIEPKLLTTDHYMIPARNAIYARAQDFEVSGGLLLLILKAFAQCTPSPHTTRNEWCLESMCTNTNIHRSCGAATASRNPHRPRHAHFPPDLVACSW